MSPLPTRRHQQCARRLANLLEQFVFQRHDGVLLETARHTGSATLDIGVTSVDVDLPSLSG